MILVLLQIYYYPDKAEYHQISKSSRQMLERMVSIVARPSLCTLIRMHRIVRRSGPSAYYTQHDCYSDKLLSLA